MKTLAERSEYRCPIARDGFCPRLTMNSNNEVVGACGENAFNYKKAGQFHVNYCEPGLRQIRARFPAQPGKVEYSSHDKGITLRAKYTGSDHETILEITLKSGVISTKDLSPPSPRSLFSHRSSSPYCTSHYHDTGVSREHSSSKICPNCGKPLPAGSLDCPNCRS